MAQEANQVPAATADGQGQVDPLIPGFQLMHVLDRLNNTVAGRAPFSSFWNTLCTSCLMNFSISRRTRRCQKCYPTLTSVHSTWKWKSDMIRISDVSMYIYPIRLKGEEDEWHG